MGVSHGVRLPVPAARATLGGVTEQAIELDLDETGVATDLPQPVHSRDGVQQVPYRPVQFRDDDLPTALERSAAWLRRAQDWLGEPLDVIAVHLDYDDSDAGPYYDVKLLCNEEDLAGAPIAVRAQQAHTP
ncbi:hypothetical protein GCM10009610_05640 [Pseudonocardia xinjiangensis]